MRREEIKTKKKDKIKRSRGRKVVNKGDEK